MFHLFNVGEEISKLGEGVATKKKKGVFFQVKTFFPKKSAPFSSRVTKKNSSFFKKRVLIFSLIGQAAFAHAGAHGVVVSHPLRMRKALGSIPSVSKPFSLSAVSLVFIGRKSDMWDCSWPWAMHVGQ